MFTIVENHIQDIGGIIFGGYVRDKIIIEHNSKLFSEHEGTKSDMFYDENHFPEFADRMLLPHDIDCIMSKKQFEEFKNVLQKDKFYIVECSEGSRNKHWNIADSFLTKVSFYVKFDVNQHITGLFSDWKVLVDLSVYDGDVVAYPTYCDLECNALIMFNGQVFLSNNSCSDLSIMERFDKLQEVISGITKKESFIAANHSLEKEDQLAERCLSVCLADGFVVKNKNFSMVYQQTDENVCYICHESTFKSFEVRRNCCFGYTHANCLHKLREKSKDFYSCPHCRDHSVNEDTDEVFIHP